MKNILKIVAEIFGLSRPVTYIYIVITLYTFKKRRIMQIEFNSYSDPRTGLHKLQLLDKDLNVLAILDQRDFIQMKRQNKSAESFQHIVDYCNECKGTNIKEFTPSFFPVS